MPPSPLLVLYSDLDGTLLDEQTYAFDAARPALERIRGLPVVLVLCTSKTRAEVEVLQRDLGVHHPFIVENGGAVYLPGGEAYVSWWEERPAGDWLKVALGIPHPELIRRLKEIRRRTRLKITGFHDMSAQAVAAACGLSVEEARRTKMREYDEPFTVTPDTAAARTLIIDEAERRGLQVSRGGRFLHLTGSSDKGRAVRVLDRLLEKRFGPLQTVGLGDSPNDLPMLEAVQRPILVRRPDGGIHPELAERLPHAAQTAGIGPAGWNEAVLKLLDETNLGGPQADRAVEGTDAEYPPAP